VQILVGAVGQRLFKVQFLLPDEDCADLCCISNVSIFIFDITWPSHSWKESVDQSTGHYRIYPISLQKRIISFIYELASDFQTFRPKNHMPQKKQSQDMSNTFQLYF
jgi:hypothetical protein